MAGQPGARSALNLVGAIIAGVLAVGLLVVAVVLISQWSSRGMVPWVADGAGFPFWWVAPLLALIGLATLAVAVSFARDWRRVRR